MIAFSNASLVRIFDIRRSSCTISTMRRPAMRASTLRRESTAGIAALVGSPMPSASTIDAIVDAVPIVMQWPAERDMHDSTSTMSDSLHLAGLQHLGELPDVRAGADVLAAELAVQHRAAGDADRRQVARRRAHQQRGRGLVAAHHQHDAVERIGANRLLDVHRHLVAEQHRRRPHQRSRRGSSPGTRSGSRRLRGRRRFTCSASSRKCALHGVTSDHVLQMPITGRPSNWSCGMPWFFIHERWTSASRSWRPNQDCERSGVWISAASCSSRLGRVRMQLEERDWQVARYRRGLRRPAARPSPGRRRARWPDRRRGRPSGRGSPRAGRACAA